jgi:hypothetical protein
MYKTLSIRGIILLFLVLILSTGMALHFLSNEGRSSMKNSISPGGVVAGKPLIDDIVTGKLETATFAMG